MSLHHLELPRFGQPRTWDARWIWPDPPGGATNVYALFRRVIQIEPTAGATLYITADSRYRLYVNGRWIADGPPPSMGHLHYYDQHDLGRFVKPGASCVAVLVHAVGQHTHSRGGLLAELTDSSGRTLDGSGPAWRAVVSPAWTSATYNTGSNHYDPYQEVHDARLLPADWTSPGFDDSSWPAAKVIAGRLSDQPPAVWPWINLAPRDIPPMEITSLRPQRVESVEECTALANRAPAINLAVTLSVAGVPLQHALVKDADNLVTGDGPMVVRCSTEHLRDVAFDGGFDPCLVLDYGTITTAYLELELEGPAGAMVEAGFVERLIDGRFNNALECQFAARYVMRQGRQVWRAFTWRGFRFVKLRFRDCDEPVTVHRVTAVRTRYPFEERGAFESSDPKLDRLFEISRHTIRLCSNESIMDTPWREQAQWLGDVALVTLPGIHACFGDTVLPAKFLRQSAASQLPHGLINNITNASTDAGVGVIPDYSLWWIDGLWEQYQYTGEAGWIDAFYPHVLKIVDYYADRVDGCGLVSRLPQWVFIDWADVDKAGQCAVVNAIFHGTLEAVGKMARLKHDQWTVQKVQRLRAGIGAAFLGRFWDESRGVVVDANHDGKRSEKVSEHANAAALLFGLCDDDRAKRIVRALWEDCSVQATEAQPFFCKVVVRALCRAGRFDLALRLIRQRWVGRFVERGYTSTPEEWTTSGSRRSGRFAGFLRSESHAWSAFPAEFLLRDLIGLEILEPGCRRVRVRPFDAGFDYRVSYPTPAGLIHVVRAGGQTTVEADEGITVE